MFKKLLVATAAMAVSATSLAGISLSGLYEGTLRFTWYIYSKTFILQ